MGDICIFTSCTFRIKLAGEEKVMYIKIHMYFTRTMYICMYLNSHGFNISSTTAKTAYYLDTSKYF